MKGIIFNLLEKFIIENFGEKSFDEIMSKCTLKTKEPFVSPGTYPDEDLVEIVIKASAYLGISVDQALQAYRKYIFPKLAAAVPQFVTPYKHPKDFLKTIENVIHIEVKKMYQDAYTPTFRYIDNGKDSLTIQYLSKRKLYALMTGLIDGVADYFNYTINQSKKIHVVDGVEVCDFNLQFTAK